MSQGIFKRWLSGRFGDFDIYKKGGREMGAFTKVEINTRFRGGVGGTKHQALKPAFPSVLQSLLWERVGGLKNKMKESLGKNRNWRVKYI